MAAMTKTEHLEHFKGARELAARLSDQIEMCERQNRVIFTPFLSQGEGMIAQRLCGRGQPYAFDGGYPGAERCCYAFLPYPDTEVRFPICLLKAAYRPRFETLTHRDVLGAFMHQGIEREQLGDIVMTQDAVYVAVSESISGYLIDQVTKIRHTPCVLNAMKACCIIRLPLRSASIMSLRCGWMRWWRRCVVCPVQKRRR